MGLTILSMLFYHLVQKATPAQVHPLDYMATIETLARHPLVGRAAAEARLRIVGLYFDIATARVYEVTPQSIAPVVEAAAARP